MSVGNKPGTCFKEHGSADAVAICMLLLQWHIYHQTLVSWVQFPFPILLG